MLIDLILLKFFDFLKLLYSNGFEVLSELRFRYHVFLVGLQVETKLQLLHNDVPECLSISCSCLCIVVCVLLSVIVVVIQGQI